jgi:hypothetical protein
MNGSDVVYTEDKGTTALQFTEKKEVMDQVNSYIERPFFKKLSRSKCEEIQLSTESRTAIQQTIFDENGSLKQSIAKIVLKQDNVGQIIFENGTFDTKRDDKRWFVKFNPKSKGKNLE